MNIVSKAIPVMVVGGGLLALNSIFSVSAGENGIVFNYLNGKFNTKLYREGYHFRIPVITSPIIYETRTRFIEETAETSNRDL